MGVSIVASMEESAERFWEQFLGPNKGYLEEQYELYKENPEAVESSIKELFDQYGAPKWLGQPVQTAAGSGASETDVTKLTSAIKLVEAIRRFGHLEADIYPVGLKKNRKTELIEPETYGLTDDDLKGLPASWLWDNAPNNVETGLDVVQTLRKYYSGTMTFQFDHVNNNEELVWLRDTIESGQARIEMSEEDRVELLDRLVEVESFEKFLHKTFVGQKRFSIEGLETMVPMLDQTIHDANTDEIDHVMVGMAHRGRLAVLAHVLGKPLDKIFSEFSTSPNKELIPSEGSRGINYGWTGDVKYHYGAETEVVDGEHSTRVVLANNPSHLEFVNPIVEGFARAEQDDRTERGFPKRDTQKAFSVLIHGDASFIGEGVVAETLNLSALPGYNIGGTIHIIANNLLGYTTDQVDGRSTSYASDLAKGFEIPIVRVNADDPISCVSAVKLAYEYRKKFKKDFLIDLVGYRRYGHNEMDEPRTTQPLLYQDIDNHPTVSNLFADSLAEKGYIKEGYIEHKSQEFMDKLRGIYDGMKEEDASKLEEQEMPKVLLNGLNKYEDTAVDLDTLKKLNQDLLKRPEGFNGFKKTERILKRREDALEEGNKADWGTGEALAYASILNDGIPIRITGQDTERGTFAHRHMVLHDTVTGEKYCPMHGLDVEASFEIRNSPLSETAVLGFEYGYSIQSPETLVIWEAQFGDFANVAQVMFDQFISAARAKWGDKSNMVMLLPHGYEGQGPEHSSARLERFLQMSAENNWIVAYPTSSAQLFHLLRRQAKLGGNVEARPLVIMTPKSSMIRNQRMASAAEEFSEGSFQVIRNQPNLKVSKKNAKRLLLGTGKVMVEMEEQIENSDDNYDWLRVLRIEQLYPFPKKELEKELKQLPNLEEIVWVQEEPQNMGAWDFVSQLLRPMLKEGQTLRYIGRTRRSAPAVGLPTIHKHEQARIINEALNPSKGEDSSERN